MVVVVGGVLIKDAVAEKRFDVERRRNLRKSTLAGASCSVVVLEPGLRTSS